MATPFKEGDFVRVLERNQTAADIKSGLYYPHFANMNGKVLKVYGEEASVLIDRDSLPDAIRDQHRENEKNMRQKWLDGLSEEGRNRLSAADKSFTLNYAVLVSTNDLAVATEPRRATEADLEAAESAALKARKA